MNELSNALQIPFRKTQAAPTYIFPSSDFPSKHSIFTGKDKELSVAYMFLFCFILKESNAKTSLSNSAAQIFNRKDLVKSSLVIFNIEKHIEQYL